MSTLNKAAIGCAYCGGEVTFTLHDGAIEVLDSSCVCAWAGSDEFNASAREALICPATPLRATNAQNRPVAPRRAMPRDQP